MNLRDQDGQALVLALAFLAFFGLVIAALLSFAGANVLATSQLREQRSETYAADGATDAAINIARTDRNIGAFGAVPCMDSSSFTVTAPDGTTAGVTCVSLAGALDQDRNVRFTATAGGARQVVAQVVFHDSATSGVLPPVDVEVKSWTYCGHDPGSCP
jgi:hypothetical protein